MKTRLMFHGHEAIHETNTDDVTSYDVISDITFDDVMVQDR